MSGINKPIIDDLNQRKEYFLAPGADHAVQLENMKLQTALLDGAVMDADDKTRIAAILTEVQQHINTLAADANRVAYQAELDSMRDALRAAPYSVTFPAAATMTSTPATAGASSGDDDLVVRTDDNKELHYKPGYEDLFGPDKHGHSKSVAEILILAWNDYRSQAFKHMLSRIYMVLTTQFVEIPRLNRDISRLEEYQRTQFTDKNLPPNAKIAQQIKDLKDRRDSLFAGNGGFGGALLTALSDKEFNRGPPASHLADREKKLIDSYIHNGVTGYSPALWYYAPRNPQNPNGSAAAVRLARLKGLELSLLELGQELTLREGFYRITPPASTLADPLVARTSDAEYLREGYEKHLLAHQAELQRREKVVLAAERAAIAAGAPGRAVFRETVVPGLRSATPTDSSHLFAELSSATIPRADTPVGRVDASRAAFEVRAELRERARAAASALGGGGPTLRGHMGAPIDMTTRSPIFGRGRADSFRMARAGSLTLGQLAPEPISATVTTPGGRPGDEHIIPRDQSINL